jgi:hypothetical protein
MLVLRKNQLSNVNLFTLVKTVVPVVVLLFNFDEFSEGDAVTWPFKLKEDSETKTSGFLLPVYLFHS